MLKRHFNFAISTWTPPHWAMIIIMAFVGAALNYVQAIPGAQLLSALATGAGWIAIGKGALTAGVISALGVAMKQFPPIAPSSFSKSEVPTNPDLKVPVHISSKPPPPAAQRKATLMFPKNHRRVAWLALPAALLIGCNGISFPVVENVAETIIGDIRAGDTEAQIANDVCKDLGGSSLTDAICGDVATVITGVVNVLLADPKAADVKPQLTTIKAHLADGSFGK